MFSIEKSALMVIDVQGRLAHMMHQKEQLFKQIQIMIEGAKLLKLPIYWLEQYPQGLGETVNEIKSLLQDQKPYEKISFSSCGQNQFVRDIKSSERNQLIITGIEAHVCVYQTVVGLLAEGFQVAVNQDAVSSRTKSNKKIGLQRMQENGAILTSTEMVLFELMQSATHPKFKDVSKLLK